MYKLIPSVFKLDINENFKTQINTVTLRNPTKTTYYFKLSTSGSKNFRAKPSSGKIGPGGQQNIQFKVKNPNNETKTINVYILHSITSSHFNMLDQYSYQTRTIRDSVTHHDMHSLHDTVSVRRDILRGDYFSHIPSANNSAMHNNTYLVSNSNFFETSDITVSERQFGHSAFKRKETEPKAFELNMSNYSYNNNLLEFNSDIISPHNPQNLFNKQEEDTNDTLSDEVYKLCIKINLISKGFDLVSETERNDDNEQKVKGLARYDLKSEQKEGTIKTEDIKSDITQVKSFKLKSEDIKNQFLKNYKNRKKNKGSLQEGDRETFVTAHSKLIDSPTDLFNLIVFIVIIYFISKFF